MSVKLEGRLSQTDVKCGEMAYCHCLFEVWRGDQLVASCTTLGAHLAALRLLGGKSC